MKRCGCLLQAIPSRTGTGLPDSYNFAVVCWVIICTSVQKQSKRAMPKHWTFTFALLFLTMPATAQDAEDVLLKSVYAGGGKTLYCATDFKPGDRLKVDFIYSEKQLLRHFGCITARQCASKSGFPEVAGDLHNLFPIERSVDLDRRGSLFGDLPEDVETRKCGYQLSFQTFDPPDAAKGDIARTMIYMHVQHKLPLVGPLEMYQRWSKLDPPDAQEKKRNDTIARIQGNRNPYIDKPDLIQKMSGF